MFPSGPVRWLIAAQALFLAGGVIAYLSAISFALWTAMALVAGLAGVWQLRMTLEGQAALWMDRSASYAAGTWAVLAMLIVMPYIVVDQGISLWASTSYQVLLFSVSCVGMLIWSAAAFQALADEAHVRAGRSYAGFHVLAWLVGCWLIIQGDGSVLDYTVRGFDVTGVDLALAPMVGAIPGMVWAFSLSK